MKPTTVTTSNAAEGEGMGESPDCTTAQAAPGAESSATVPAAESMRRERILGALRRFHGRPARAPTRWGNR